MLTLNIDRGHISDSIFIELDLEWLRRFVYKFIFRIWLAWGNARRDRLPRGSRMSFVSVRWILLVLVVITGRVGLVIAHPVAPPTVAAPDFASFQRVPVASVVDGHTILVGSEDALEKVRLLGIDCPETGQSEKERQFYGHEAVVFVANLLEGEQVFVVPERLGEKDRHGSTLAYVYRASDGLFVNAELVRQGYGSVSEAQAFQHMDAFLQYERAAKAEKKGLWNSAARGRWEESRGALLTRPIRLRAVLQWVFYATLGCVAFLCLLHAWPFSRLKDRLSLEAATAVRLGTFWLLAALLWWSFAGNLQIDKMAQLVASSFIGVAAGALLGFIFTSYAEENTSIGKVRDLLVGGLAGVALSQVATASSSINTALAILANGDEASKSLHLCSLVTFSVLGFLFMFYVRERFWNVTFAEARRKRKDLEQAVDRASAVLPHLSTGKLSQVSGMRVEPSEEALRAASQVVEKVEGASVSAKDLDPQRAFVVAQSYLYKRQFAQAIPILQSIVSRGAMLPQAVALLAESYYELGRREDTVAILEQYAASLGDEVHHLLGYYLLWIPNRLIDAVDHSSRYLKSHPTSSATYLNRACGYSQLFGKDRSRMEYRTKALADLADAVRLDHRWKIKARRLMLEGEDFAPLANDPQFLEIINE